MIVDNEIVNSSSRIIWYNGDHYIYLDQDQQSSNKLTLDTEESPYTQAIMGEYQIYYINENNTYIFIWIENGYQFSLYSHSSLAWDCFETFICSISLAKSN